MVWSYRGVQKFNVFIINDVKDIQFEWKVELKTEHDYQNVLVFYLCSFSFNGGDTWAAWTSDSLYKGVHMINVANLR